MCISLAPRALLEGWRPARFNEDPGLRNTSLPLKGQNRRAQGNRFWLLNKVLVTQIQFSEHSQGSSLVQNPSGKLNFRICTF